MAAFRESSDEDGLISTPEAWQRLQGVSLTEEDIRELAEEVIGETDIEEELAALAEAEEI